MGAIFVTHPRPLSNGRTTPEGNLLLYNMVQPLLKGTGEIVTTGVLRTDQPGTSLSQMTGLPRRVVRKLGPIRGLPLPSPFSGTLFYSAISSPSISEAILFLWTLGLLPGCEPPEVFTRRVAGGLREAEGAIAIISRETELARMVIFGEKPSLIEAIKEGVPPPLHIVLT